jgi:predicted TPR repeat methyltransferase
MRQQPYKKFAYFYDTIYRGRFYNDYTVFITKIIKERRIKKPSILDIACGTGLLIKNLKKKFQLIEGLDSSKEMLAIAKEKNKGIKFYNQSMINFNIRKKYNIIVCTFDSINYITNKKNLWSVFRSVSAHLSHRGIFIFDFNTVNKKIMSKFTKGNITYFNEIKDKLWSIVLEIKVEGKTYRETHQERFYSLGDMRLALRKNKFKIVNAYSSFNKKIGAADKYGRIFIVAEKI